MKYILKIMLVCLALIPFMIWELLVSLWNFDLFTARVLWRDFKDTVGYNYRRAFGQSRKNKPSTF